MARAINTNAATRGADIASSLHGAIRAGMTISVVSDSFHAEVDAGMAAGALPSVTVLSDGPGSEEGCATPTPGNGRHPGTVLQHHGFP